MSGMAGIGAAAVGEVDGSVFAKSDSPTGTMDAAVAAAAEQYQICDLAAAAGNHMVGVCKCGRRSAAGKTTATVSGNQRSSDLGGNLRGGIADRDGLRSVEHDRHDGRVAWQRAGRDGAQARGTPGQAPEQAHRRIGVPGHVHGRDQTRTRTGLRIRPGKRSFAQADQRIEALLRTGDAVRRIAVDGSVGPRVERFNKRRSRLGAGLTVNSRSPVDTPLDREKFALDHAVFAGANKIGTRFGGLIVHELHQTVGVGVGKLHGPALDQPVDTRPIVGGNAAQRQQDRARLTPRHDTGIERAAQAGHAAQLRRRSRDHSRLRHRASRVKAKQHLDGQARVAFDVGKRKQIDRLGDERVGPAEQITCRFRTGLHRRPRTIERRMCVSKHAIKLTKEYDRNVLKPKVPIVQIAHRGNVVPAGGLIWRIENNDPTNPELLIATSPSARR